MTIGEIKELLIDSRLGEIPLAILDKACQAVSKAVYAVPFKCRGG